MKIFYDFTTDETGVITSSSEDGNFQLSNVRNQLLSNKFKFTSNSDETITFSFNESVEIDSIGLQSNLTNSATVQLELVDQDIIDGGTNTELPADDYDFGTNSFLSTDIVDGSLDSVDIINGGTTTVLGTDIINGGTTATLPTDIISGNPSDDEAGEIVPIDITSQNNFGVFYQMFDQSYNVVNISIRFTDTDNTDVITIGRLVFGISLDLPDIRSKPKITYNNTSTSQLSRSGQLFGIKGYQYRIFDFSIPKLLESDKDELYTLLETVARFKPVFMDIFCNSIEPIIYGTILQNGFTFTYQDADIYTLGIKVREVF